MDMAGLDNPNPHTNPANNPFANTNGSDILSQKEGFLLNMDAYKQNNGGAGEEYFLERPTNGSNKRDEFDDDDLGPETDVDAVDDVLMSPTIAAAKAALADGVANNNPGSFDFGGTELEDKVAMEMSLQNNQFFEPIRSAREETPTPPAHEVHQDAGLVDNVAESGDESEEDEWNYFKGDSADKENVDSSQQDQEVAALTRKRQEEEEDDTMSQLNPDAAEFVPVSPTHSVDSPACRALKHDTVIAQSPRRASPQNIDIKIPSRKDFECEILNRPSEVTNGHENGHKTMSTSELMENILNGKNIDEIPEFQPNNTTTPTKLASTDEFHFGPNAAPFSTPAKLLDQSEAFSTKADFGDGSYLENTFSENTFSENNPFGDTQDFTKVMNKESDPMSMSFYQDEDESNNPFDLNKVQKLPDYDEDDEEELIKRKSFNEIICEQNPSKADVDTEKHEDVNYLGVCELPKSPVLDNRTPEPTLDENLCVIDSPEPPMDQYCEPMEESEKLAVDEKYVEDEGFCAKSPALSDYNKSPEPLEEADAIDISAASPECVIPSPEPIVSPESALSPTPMEIEPIMLECSLPLNAGPGVPMPRDPVEDHREIESPLEDVTSSIKDDEPLSPIATPEARFDDRSIEENEQNYIPVMASPIQEYVASPIHERIASPASGIAPMPEIVKSVVVESPILSTSPILSASPVPEVAASPVFGVAAASPLPEIVASPVFEVAATPVSEIAASPIPEVVTSPIHEIIGSPVFEVAASPVVEDAKSPQMSPVKDMINEIVEPAMETENINFAQDLSSAMQDSEISSLIEENKEVECSMPVGEAFRCASPMDQTPDSIQSEPWRCVYPMQPQDVEITTELIEPQHPVETVLSPEELPTPELAPKLDELVAESCIVPAVLAAAVVTAVASADTKKTKPKTATPTAKKLVVAASPKTAAISPIKRPTVPSATKAPLAKTKSATSPTKPTAAKLATKPASASASNVTAAKAAPKPRAPITRVAPATAAEKKSLTNGDVKASVAKTNLTAKRVPISAPGKVAAKPAPARVSPAKIGGNGAGAARTVSAPAARLGATARPATMAAPKPRPTTLTTRTTATTNTNKMNTTSNKLPGAGAARVPATKAATTTATTAGAPKPRPATAPIPKRMPITRPAAKAPDTEKQNKENVNKLTAARTTTTRTITKTSTTVRKADPKAPISRTTAPPTTMKTTSSKPITKRTATTTTEMSKNGPIKSSTTRTTTIKAITKPKENGVSNGVSEETSTTTQITTNETIISSNNEFLDPTLLKDLSPVENNVSIENNLQLLTESNAD